jgi:hypothetical protein
VGDGGEGGAGGGGVVEESWKVALTALAVSRKTSHAPAPEQAPVHPRNLQPLAGIASSCTAVPLSNAALQLAPQLMPLGSLRTDPSPVLNTVRARVRGGPRGDLATGERVEGIGDCRVPAGTARDDVALAVAGYENVVSCSAEEAVSPWPPDETIVSLLAVEPVVPSTSLESVLPRSSEDQIVATAPRRRSAFAVPRNVSLAREPRIVAAAASSTTPNAMTQQTSTRNERCVLLDIGSASRSCCEQKKCTG